MGHLQLPVISGHLVCQQEVGLVNVLQSSQDAISSSSCITSCQLYITSSCDTSNCNRIRPNTFHGASKDCCLYRE